MKRCEESYKKKRGRRSEDDIKQFKRQKKMSVVRDRI